MDALFATLFRWKEKFYTRKKKEIVIIIRTYERIQLLEDLTCIYEITIRLN